jgi:hypothetical protein
MGTGIQLFQSFYPVKKLHYPLFGKFLRFQSKNGGGDVPFSFD